MSHILKRNFQTSARSLVQFTGAVPFSDIYSMSEPDGHEWSESIDIGSKTVEQVEPRITEAKIQGAFAHKSSKDKADPKKVITVGFYTNRGTQVGSVHFYSDGSFKLFPSRAGTLGGYAQNLRKAGFEVEDSVDRKNAKGSTDGSDTGGPSSSG